MWPFDILEDAVNYLIEMLPMLAALILYLPMVLFEAVYNAVIAELNIVLAFINALIDLYNLFIVMIVATFTDVWPSSIITYLIGIQILIVVLLRLYHFGKDISIAGFKI